LISSINFINLTISNISTRVKEIGIRKTNGAHNKQIAFQFILESVLFWFVGFITAWMLYWLMGKALASFLNFDITISNSEYSRIIVFSFFGLLAFNLITSIFPITFMSHKRIMGLIKSTDQREKQFSLRNGFVCLQFILSALIILSSLLVQKQINFIVNKDKGYDTNNVLMVSGWALSQDKRETFINDLKAYSVIESVTSSEEFFGDDPSMTSVNFEPFRSEDQFHTSVFDVDDAFVNAFKIQLVEGRFFDKERKSDFDAVVLNESAAKEYLGKGSVIGKKLRNGNKRYEIIGIVKDFNFRSLYYKIQPLIIRRAATMGNLYIKVDNNQMDKALSVVQALWGKYKVSEPLDYTFHNEVIVNQYRKDMQAKKLLNILSVISVIIACVGLYAISFNSIIKKTKEIGVRKVSGAKISEVVLMLNVDFIKWVILAFVIATPIAWYLMNKWLNSFAYKTELSWWIFLLAGIIAVLVAIVTVSWQSYRAATRNPVEALRYE
jgi:putative ABC transport system permease protein